MQSSPYSYPPLAPDARGGFVTAYLPDYPGGDWVCIEDFCGSWDGFGIRDRLNVCAWWSPSRGHVAFGGQWIGVPPMPATTEPTDAACWDWVRQSDTVFARRMLAMERKRAKEEARTKAIADHYACNGYNWVTVTLTLPDGSSLVVSQCVGLRTWQEVLRAATGGMARLHPVGTRITSWRFETGITEIEVTQRQEKARKCAA